MTTSLAASSLRTPSGNGHVKIITIKKRNGVSVPYGKDKITQAVKRCLVNSCQWPENHPETLAAAEKVATQVDSLLIFKPVPITVEMVQDIVEQQLMACGLYDAAKEYILYRAEHRKLREEQPVDPVIAAAFKAGCSHFTGPNSPAQIFQAFDKFARFDYTKGRREVWPESVDRVVKYAKAHMTREHNGIVSEGIWQDLERSLLQLEVSPSMRLVQMAGPALDRCQTGVYNCSYQFLQGPTDMAEELYLLMQGCGVGFSTETQYAVDKWPRVKKQRNAKPDTFIIADTTEGWCDSYKVLLERLLDGHDIVHDYGRIRDEGTPLKTKGGRASGPQPLKDLHNFTRNIFLARQGDRLRDIDIYDTNCYSHRIVQMGGVRRASGLGLSDRDSMAMRHCKDGAFWEKNPQRNQANNSVPYDERPTAVEFMEEWIALAKSGSGERGIFNRGALRKQFPKRRTVKGHVFGTNPCGEIVLRHKEFCNLSIAVIRQQMAWEEIQRRVVLATIWGTIQSTMTNFKYIGPEWKKNCEEERLLGVDLLGHLDHQLFKPGTDGLDARLRELRDLVVKTNAEWAQRLGINASAATTCGKPSGDSSLFFNAAAGMKGWHGEYFIRRTRVSDTNPVGIMLRDQGVPCFPDYDKSGLMVLEFPCKAPEGAAILGGQSAIEQLEHWKTFKVNFTEHNPSVTVYVKDSEWLAVGHWVFENWDYVGGLSFCPFNEGHYPLMPYETITAEEYEQRQSNFPDIKWENLVRYEKEDMTDCHQQIACTGGVCMMV